MIQDVKRIYLCSPDRKPVTVLNGVRTDTVDYHYQLKGYSELTFTTDRYIVINGQQVISNGYDELKPYMYLYLENIGFFQMQTPSITNDGNQETKDITAYSVEKEFSDKDWVGVKINTGTEDSMEHYDQNLDIDGFAINYVTMLNENNEKLSFLHQILKDIPYWGIGYVDPMIKNQKIPNIEIDNENRYAIMTSMVAPRLSCLFVFDFHHFLVNVYYKNSVDLDTGIFIGFRNLEQQVSISVDEDSIFTRFNVEGENGLTVQDWNYGDRRIINLSYFLGYPYMEEELAQKIKDWLQFREDNLDEYIEYVRQQIQLQEKYDQIKYMVPADQSYYKNWSNMRLDGLQENLKYYNKLLQRFQEAVDPRDESVKYKVVDNEKVYQPKMKNGKVDHDWYIDLLYAEMGKYTGYYTYKEIVEYIIPYIELAIENSGKPEWQQKSLEDAGLTDRTEDWDLYGLDELEGVKLNYEDDLLGSLSRYDKAWEQMSDEEKQIKALDYTSKEGYENSAGRQKYLYLKQLLGPEDGSEPGTINHRLKILHAELDDLQAQLDEIAAIRSDYNNLMKYDVSEDDLQSYTHVDNSVLEGRRPTVFTEDEQQLITALFHDTDYVNSNIFTHEYISVLDTLDIKKELLDDAEDKLFEASQPQYVFTANLDNFLMLPDYEQWRDVFISIGDSSYEALLPRFVRLGIRDDYAVKLRIIGYRFNPCEVTQELEIEFSNMITSKSGRSDLVQLLDTENNVGSKNSISIGTGNSKSDQDYITALLGVLTNNTIFTRSVSSIASGTSGNIDPVELEQYMQLLMENMTFEASSIKVTNIVGTHAEFEEMFSEYLASDFIATKLIDADQAKIQELAAEVITIGTDEITTIANGVISTATINADQITSGTINADRISTNTIASKLASIDQADVSLLFADNAFVRELQSISNTSVNSIVNDAYIRNAVVGKISVGDLTAGNIVLTDNMIITSNNGKMIMNGTALQIKGVDKNGNEYVGIQLGYDTSQNPSLVLTNSNGAIVLTPEGITSDAIADQLIVDDMIHDNTISESKLGFSIIKPNQYGGIDISNIYDGSTQFGASYTSFTTHVESSINTIEAGTKYRIEIISDNGTVLSPNDVYCILSCKVYEWNVDITDTISEDNFIWHRTSSNAEEDEIWNSNHNSGAKQIALTGEDINGNTRFTCVVNIDDAD